MVTWEQKRKRKRKRRLEHERGREPRHEHERGWGQEREQERDLEPELEQERELAAERDEMKLLASDPLPVLRTGSFPTRLARKRTRLTGPRIIGAIREVSDSDVRKGTLVPVTENESVALRRNVSGAENDDDLIGLFLRRYEKKSVHTHRAYRIDVARFRAALPKPLRRVTAKDLLDFRDGVLGERPHRRRIATVKSLFRFAARMGYLPFNTAEVIETEKQKDTLQERILTEVQVAAILDQFPDKPSRQLLLRFLYGTAARISEALTVQARDLIDREDGRGQVTLYGKGKKTRVVLLPKGLWRRIRSALPKGAAPVAPLFRWSVRRAEEIVTEAARRAGVPKATPHWLRHAHATHALQRKVSVTVIKETLGHASIATTDRYLHAMPGESSALVLDREET